MAYKLRYNLFHWLFRLFSFLSDRTGGWRLFVKPKLFWGLLVLGLSATACNSKENKNESNSENSKENDSIQEINSQMPEMDTMNITIGNNFIPEIVNCYDMVVPKISCYVPVPIDEPALCYYHSVEMNPEFPGGEAELIKFLQQNLTYPDEMNNGSDITGKVICRFAVAEDGSISDIQILKSLAPTADEEVIRVVKSMPKWIPGSMNGKKAKVYYVLPVTFKLE